MSVPDRIERTLKLAHPPATVWAALTTAEGLAGWFGDEAAIDLRPGGAARLRWRTGESAEMRVERVEEPSVFAYSWATDDSVRTLVEFTLEPTGEGTRLHVVETGFAGHAALHADHLEGWERELGELVEHLDAA